jgi:hypothetical protein
MKRIRKPTDKEIHSVAPVRRKVNNNNQREKQAAVLAPVTLSAEPRNLPIEWHAPSVTLSLRDRASQLALSEDQMSCRGAEVGNQLKMSLSSTLHKVPCVIILFDYFRVVIV